MFAYTSNFEFGTQCAWKCFCLLDIKRWSSAKSCKTSAAILRQSNTYTHYVTHIRVYANLFELPWTIIIIIIIILCLDGICRKFSVSREKKNWIQHECLCTHTIRALSASATHTTHGWNATTTIFLFVYIHEWSIITRYLFVSDLQAQRFVLAPQFLLHLLPLLLRATTRYVASLALTCYRNLISIRDCTPNRFFICLSSG